MVPDQFLQAVSGDTEADRARALFESQRRLAFAIRATADAVWEWNLATNKTYYSPRWFEMLGHADQAFEMTFDAWKALCHPDDFEATVARIAAILEAPQSAGYEVEFRMRTASGQYRWILGRGNVVERDASGRAQLLSGTNTDITERKRAAELIADGDRRLRFLTDHVPTVMLYQIVVDTQGNRRFTFVSAAVERLHAVTPEQVLADPMTLYSQICEGDRERVLAAELSSISDCSPFEVEVQFLCGSQAPRWALLRSSPRRQPDGSTIWDGVEVDITQAKQQEAERIRLEESLRQAQKMESVGRLAGGVAHDFHNMLTAIMGNIAMARLELLEGDPVRELLNEAHDAAESAENLTKQLLAFSRKQVVVPRVLDLNAVALSTKNMLVRVLGEHIRLKLQLDESLGATVADLSQVEQVLVNLAVNARDAMPDGGTLSLATQNVQLDEGQAGRLQVPLGSYVTLSVGDTGTGMTPQVQARLFEPFFTTKGVGQGTGLGLAMVYGCVKQSGGAVDVLSELGRGSQFTVYLPRVDATPEAPAPRAIDGLRRGVETILLVEDERVVRNLARVVLTRQGYNVLAFASGADALAALETNPVSIDLLLTDLVMPGMNGRELAERVVLRQPRVRVLFTSGYTEDTVVHRGIAEKGIEFIAKPYSVHELAERVRVVLDSAQR